MRIVQEGLSRRAVIEKYAIYDFQKKRGSQLLPNFDAWNWSSADAIDEELCRVGLKTGIPAGYLSWHIVQITVPDFRECAVVVDIFSEQRQRQLGVIERIGGLVNWEEKLFQHLGDRQVPSWYDHIKHGEVLSDSAPFLLRPSVSCERPAQWYVEDGSGRAVTFVANAKAFAPLETVATGFLGTVPDVSAGAKIDIVPVEKCATPGRSPASLILEAEEGRMCSGGETWMRSLSLNGRD